MNIEEFEVTRLTLGPDDVLIFRPDKPLIGDQHAHAQAWIESRPAFKALAGRVQVVPADWDMLVVQKP